ncbi:MAG: MlaE family ABC transporter permease [Alphaproteobacteria bacterium]
MIEAIERLGRATMLQASESLKLLSFLGAVLSTIGMTVLRPRTLRIRALVAQMERTGLDAMPIVGLLTFLVGVVSAYQGADQLARFGAQIFTVNIIGLGILREMGVLITAIVVAGRSGSAFAAEIGTMRVNQEIDALETLGLDPLRVLVLPRVLGVTLAMPFLTFFANVMGIFGGAVMAAFTLDITLPQFAERFQQTVPLQALWVGLVKAPLFAFLIGLVGCFQGMMVQGNAESVGRRTTTAVVQGVFMVIVADALLSVFFSIVGI